MARNSKKNGPEPRPDRLKDAFRRSARATHLAEECYRYLLHVARGEELPTPKQFDIRFLRSKGRTSEQGIFEYTDGSHQKLDREESTQREYDQIISIEDQYSYSSRFLSFFKPFFDYSEITDKDYIGIQDYVDEDSTLPSWMAILEWENTNHHFSLLAREGKQHLEDAKDLFNTHRIFNNETKVFTDITDTYAFESKLVGEQKNTNHLQSRFLPSAIIVKEDDYELNKWRERCDFEDFRFNSIVIKDRKSKEIDHWIRREYRNGVNPIKLPKRVSKGETKLNAEDFLNAKHSAWKNGENSELDGIHLDDHKWYKERVKENGLQSMLAYLLWLRSLSIPQNSTEDSTESNNFKVYFYFPFFNLAKEYVNSITMGFPGWPDPVLLKSIQETADKAFQRSAVRQAERSRKEGQEKAAAISGHEAGPQLTTAERFLPAPERKMKKHSYKIIEGSIKYAHLFLNETSAHVPNGWLPWCKEAHMGKKVDEWAETSMQIAWQIAVAREARDLRKDSEMQSDSAQVEEMIWELFKTPPATSKKPTVSDDLLRFSPTGAEDNRFSYNILRWILSACSNAFKWSATSLSPSNDKSNISTFERLKTWAEDKDYFCPVGVAFESEYRLQNEEMIHDPSSGRVVLSVFNACSQDTLPDSPHFSSGTLRVLKQVGSILGLKVIPLKPLEDDERNMRLPGETHGAVSRLELPRSIFGHFSS